MPQKRYKPEQIIDKLRESEVELSKQLGQVTISPSVASIVTEDYLEHSSERDSSIHSLLTSRVSIDMTKA